ncbi:fibrinolytic enzyme, isozyme C-like isoform X1 [Biomphalaria glabrata]|uniref:Fibrinolytic enzyme, isozyme C-like isoform X1 n=2 Tax=Biomphalaria glabrata TaxID=6526 RepID=A0A9W3AF74_BIOGL|nr:fibrinolytic enzyme, isozyme C-like isoform X1 [Biomphalaria glabrata]
MLILTSLFISLLVVKVSYVLAISSVGKSLKRIVNGQTATMFEIPCQAELQIKLDGTWSHWCGGVLVTPNKVLTAAHCMDDSAVSNYRVVVGMLNLYGPSSKYQQTLKVSHIHKHESIKDKYDYSNPHDIAVITLATSATLNRNVQPARLAKNVNQYFLTDCLISGWGYTSGTKPKPNTLQKAITKIVPNFECVNYWPTMSVALNGGLYLCVYDDEGSPRTGTCVGDSGGPLLCGPNKDTLVGILSGGDAECDADYPALYVNLSAYGDWLSGKL